MRRAPEGGLVVLVLACLAIGMTWPLARHPSTHVYDPAGISRAVPGWVHPDVHLTVWIVGWVARVLPVTPGRLFDAPIFHPVPDALAYSEHLLGVAPITVPAYWIGGAVFAHQVLLVATFVLSALAMAALAGVWTRSAAGALVAGALYAFAPWRFHELHGVHLESVFYLPLVLLAAERWLATGRAPWLAGLVLALTAQALAAYALAYPAFAAVIPFVLVLALVARVSAARLAGALAGVVAAGLLVAVVSLPYLRVQRPEAAPVPVVATWTPENLQRTQSARLASYVDGRGATYLGGVTLTLAAAGLLLAMAGVRGAGAVAPRPIAAALLATTTALVVLSLGPHAGAPLAWLWAVVPGLPVFRVPQRFGFLVSLPVAAFGGLAAAALADRGRRLGGTGAVWAIAGALVAAACWQAPGGAIAVRPFPAEGETPAVYGWLARQDCGDRCAVLEVPAGPAWNADPPAVYWTLAHGHPVVNGYSGFAPAAYPMVVSLAGQLPAVRARAALANLTGVRWFLVHRAHLTAAERDAWDALAPPEAARFGDDVLYDAPAPALGVDWRPWVVEAPADVTFAGTPLAPLPSDGTAVVHVDEPPAAPTRAVVRVAASVRNAGRTRWPALTSRSRLRVTLELRWLGAGGPVPGLPVESVVLPVDLGAGEEVRVAARLPTPAAPGTYTVEGRVVQGGGAALAGVGRVTVHVVAP